ncbi:zinc finger protein interacting with ribonucleoprotein K-like [Topomyia yanbarensis]|uniref:zinc finger protein interacting with ribonucleoprotein K-like n=1 Tax=Topomyia yanbarensis TaxID=2498891 RepID=UPI00273BC1FF|nr:zinc finger protein interacting with ribonucleoprotein K-like [Topomyia yanbarensis]
MSAELTGECTPELSKRLYTRRVSLCRLCLQDYPKDQLVEIFGRGSDWKRRIFSAVGIKPHRKDHSTRLCRNCQTMLDVIITFQQICQRMNQLLSLESRAMKSGWKKATEAIKSINEAVQRYRNDVLSIDNGLDKISEPVSEFCEKIKSESEAEEEPTEKTDDQIQLLVEMEIKEEKPHYEDYQQHQSEESSEDSEEKPKKQTGRKGRRKRSNHSKSNDKVMCDTCGQLISQVCLEGHLNRHLGIKPFVCEIEGCGRRLHSKYSLQQHRHLHKSIMRYYDCPDCGKRIKGTSSWLRHKKMHTEEPKFACEVCGKKFRRKTNLKLHAVVHTGVALYPCEICGKYFTVKHNLGAHYKTHKKKGTNSRTTQPQLETNLNRLPLTEEQNQLPYESLDQ